MTKPIIFGNLEVDVVSSMEECRSMVKRETPIRIAVLGDFSGRANRGIFKPGAPIAGHRTRSVDRDNFDTELAKLNAEIMLSLADSDNPPVKITFSELDDFHPDQLFERVEAFQILRETRRKLDDPQKFEAAAQEVQSWPGTAADDVAPLSEPKAAKSEAAMPKASGLLDQIIDETDCSTAATGSTMSSSSWNAFLQGIVKPHLVADTDSRQENLKACVDEAAAELMRTILHHPDFQIIEAAWRGLHFLVSRMETDADLKIHLCDISKEELAADLEAAEDLSATEAYRVFVEQTTGTSGGERWSLLAGNYTFNPTCEDAQLLRRLGKIACRAGSHFIAAASPRLVGCNSLHESPDPDDWTVLPDRQAIQAWETLIRRPEASRIGLALPRFLLRLPYGAETDPIDRFDFEEMPGHPVHSDYLWGNPVNVCAHLLSQTLCQKGDGFRMCAIRQVDGLPLHVYKEDGEARLLPCAEVLLSERAMGKILDKGFMPLLSMKNTDAVRLARFQSLSDPTTYLAGRWC